ncbi:DUF4389 domain-containing protein [Nocardia sp. NPDC050406]|uniref:DUF4389 domain-containing protein n=1 Tax=Nocardia sp. NPDC050406 TaxID=3364318 RepID=UPI0037A5D522
MTGPEHYPTTGPEPVGVEPSVDLDIFPPEQHSRLTVLFRLLLVIPQVIVLWFLGLAAFVVLVCGWFGALVLGRLPQWCDEFLRGYLTYTTRVTAYGMLLVDAYPPFAWNPVDYPVRVLYSPATPLNRLAVLFRIVLAFPIVVLSSWFATGWAILAFFLWVIVLVTGRMPRAVFEATAAVVRIELRTNAYTYLVTPTYLKGVFGDSAPLAYPNQPPAQSPTRPLVVAKSGRILLIAILILGILGSIGQTAAQSTVDYDDSDTVSVSQTR